MSLAGIEPDCQHYQRSLVPLNQTSVLKKMKNFRNINFVWRFFFFPAVCTKDLRKKGDELDSEIQSRMDSGILHINTHIRNSYIQNRYTSASELKSKGTSYEHMTDLEMFLSFIKCYFQVGWMRCKTVDNRWTSFENLIDELTFVSSITWGRAGAEQIHTASPVVENLSLEVIVWHLSSCPSNDFKHIKQSELYYFYVASICCPYIITWGHTDRWHWSWLKICWMWIYHNEELTLTYATIVTNHVYMYDIVGEGAFLP